MIKAPSDNPTNPAASSVRLPWESLDGDEPVSAGAEAQGRATPPGEPAGPPAAEIAPATATASDTFVVDDTDAESDVHVALEPEPPAPGAAPELGAAPEPEPECAYDDFDPVEYESPLPAEPLIDDLGPPPGGGWPVVSLCVGVGIIACCVLIPQADANRRLAYEREKLRSDLESIRKQVATNDEFLRRVADDPNLAERLAQRQMKIIREGTRVLELKKDKASSSADAQTAGGALSPGLTPDEMSPFHLVQVEPPPPLPPYEPRGGLLAGLCYNPRSRLYVIGTGLFLMAVGVVLGFAPAPPSTIRPKT